MTVTAIDRSLSVIECLAGEPRGLELSAIAARLDLPKSAAHRILVTLVERGWVAQDSENQTYVLSLRFAMLALRDLDSRVITDVVQRVLDGLAQRTREYARIAIVEGETLTWVARAQGAVSGLRYDPEMGIEVSLHTTATGKVWLSSLPEDEALRIVCARGLRRGTHIGPNAVKTVDDVRQALRETRQRGYATAVEEAEAGITAVAVAFRRDTAREAPVAGTLSIAGPATRMGVERHLDLVTALRVAAAELEQIWRLRGRQNREVREGAKVLKPVTAERRRDSVAVEAGT